MDDNKNKTRKENEDRVAEEYLSSLADLNCNSKPLINMLTMLAEENIEYASIIVNVVEQHIHKVPPDYKLSILYLIDSIVKNVKGTYIQLFSQCIVNIFCGVFEKVNEKVRERMYSLRQTWNEVFSVQKLYTLDVKIKQLDQNWPITAKITQPAIHVNPNFLKPVSGTSQMSLPADMDEILQAKTRELLELKKRKLELELEATKKHLENQEKQINKGHLPDESNMLPPEQPNIEDANVPSQILVPPNHMMGMGQAGIHQANFRNPRPHGMFLMGNNNTRQPRVNPVNPSLLNTLRHRDPRLARQQQQQQEQQQQQQQMKPIQNNINRRNHSSQDKETNSTSRTSSSTSLFRHKSSRDSKSPSRSYSSRSSSSRSESSSISKNSQSNKSSSKDKQRSHSGSSSKKNSSNDRHSKSHSRSVEKDNADRSTSSNGSNSTPSKSKDGSTKRTSSGSIKSSPSAQQQKARSRSSSPFGSKLESDDEMHAKPAEKRHKLEDHQRTSIELQQEQQADKSFTTNSSMTSSKDLDKTNSTNSFEGGIFERFGQRKGLIDSRIFVPLTFKTPVDRTLWKENVDDDENELLSSHNSSNNNINDNLSQKQQHKQREIVEKYKVAREEVEQRHLSNVNASATTTANTTPFNNKVSFRINKIHNKILEKSTENFSTAFTGSLSSSLAASLLTAKNSSGNSSATSTKDKRDSDAIKQIMDIDGDCDNEDGNDINNTNYDDDDEKNKRKSTKLVNEEPAIKKSKQINKIDALFGDNDLEMQKITSATKSHQNEDWSSGNKKRAPISPKKSPTTSSNLDDVRAKLAKAVKLNKMGKSEKLNRDLQQRLKVTELNINDDSLDANDEKIRTILTQAQELLDIKSINQDQYRNLLQTVMSINETNKLKEAKRRESLKTLRSGGNKQQQPQQQNQQHSVEDEEENSEDAYERERLAAREAILKKRIPKISKNSNNTSNNNSSNNKNNNNGATNSPRSDTGNSPLYEDTTDAVGNSENVESVNRRQQNMNSNNNTTNKRQKPSKWGDRVDVPVGQRNWPIARTTNVAAGSQPPRMNFRNNLPPQPNNLRMPHFTPFQNNNNNQQPQIAQPPPLLLRSNIPPPPQPPLLGIRLPAPPVAAAKPCNSIDNPQADLVRSITIDGQSKEIRIYGAVAIVFMDLDQPREIGFKHGQRAVVIDNGEPILLKFNDVYKPVHIAGVVHQMRFGFPSRELYIDDHWYEIYFGGAAVQIPINGKMHLLTAEGPPPQVHIGPLRRDLVMGKINMIVDALIVIPLFLDAHLQSFQLGENRHTIQFADNLLTVLIDGDITKVEYGGLPKSYTLGGKKYFIRFGALPQGVVAGKVRIKDMIYVNESSPLHDLVPNDALPPVGNIDNNSMSTNTNIATAATAAPPPISMSALGNLNIDELFQKLVSTGILSGATKPVAENLSTKFSNAGSIEPTNLEVVSQDSNAIAPAAAIASEENEGPSIIPIDLSQPDSIKTRQQSIINMLFNGMQCSSCGVRFPPEQTIKYSQHLDWHFRQNRRERDSARKAHSRKWYYSLADWMQYKEIEDIEEREKNYFESQQQLDADEEDSSSNPRAPSPEPTCAAGTDDVDRTCDMCHEKFEQFYNEELEEWHLRSAIRVEDKIYHPPCHEDFKLSLNPPKQDEEKDESMANANDDNAMDVDIKMENTELKEESSLIDDDDDDVIVLPNEEPTITELDDDDEDEYVPTNVTREEMGDLVFDETSKCDDDIAKPKKPELTAESDADIEIQEPHIPFTDLDNYVEKVLPAVDTDGSPLTFVKIKEEPKDEDEDDGFEEVGTVLTLPDEQITINSDDTQSQPLVSSLITSENATSMPATEVDITVGEASNQEAIGTTTDIQSNNVAIDGNQEPEDKHNLSATGVAPAVVPLASLVNKIKINITKNINLSSATTANTIATATTNTNSALAQQPGENISNIPVLYGGATTISTLITSGGGADVDADDYDIVGGASTCSSPPLVPVEDTMTYELKPALKNANLKKTKKVEAGVETSGLCSIM